MFDYLTLVQVTRALRMIIDIVIVWIILYYLIRIVRSNSKTTQIFKGIIFVLIVQAVAKYFGLETLAYLTDTVITWGFLAIIIIFQPEIRFMLERLGKSNLFTRMSTLSGNEKEELVQALMDATSNLAESKTGALITLEQTASLSEYIKTGVPMNSMVTAELLCSIFATTTPLHDGAVIIQGDKLACASAYFPPTSLDLPSRYGARHRAAIGISEITDSVTIVVSEETGRVAIAEQGKLIQMNERKLRAYLNRVILNKEQVTSESVAQTRSESVSIDSLFQKEAEELDVEEDFKAVESEETPTMPEGPRSVVIIDENDERVVEAEEEVVHKAKMKTFKKADFKNDSTMEVPLVTPEGSEETVKPEPPKGKRRAVKVKNEEELKAEVQAEIQQALQSTKVFTLDEEEEKKQEKGGILQLFKKDKGKTPKKSSVEQAVKEVAKEFHTTQQLKLKEIQEAEAQAASEEAKKRLAETKKLVLPQLNKKPTAEKAKPAINDAPPIKPIEITRVSRQQAKAQKEEEATGKRGFSVSRLKTIQEAEEKPTPEAEDSKGGDR